MYTKYNIVNTVGPSKSINDIKHNILCLFIIPNHENILNTLKNIYITPISQTHYLKADIEEYEHTLSFRRKMFIKHDVVEKRPGSITIKYYKRSPI